MNTIKDLLKNHSEQPSDEVWQKLNARLDAEMPVGKSFFWSRLSTAKKFAAAAVAGLLMVGGVALGYVMNHKEADKTEHQNMASVKPAQKVDGMTAKENTVVVESVDAEKSVNETSAEKEVAIAQEKPALVAESVSAAQENTSAVSSKANVKQEVLPANSTLAKQLSADPVLKNLSDGSIDGSKPVHLTIPNLFTPNGDGVNDQFVIEGLDNYTSPKLVIRDKNGRQVYQNNNYQNTWSGENCPEGVYSYELTFLYNGIENQAVGKVRIMRG